MALFGRNLPFAAEAAIKTSRQENTLTLATCAHTGATGPSDLANDLGQSRGHGRIWFRLPGLLEGYRRG